jgi:hypothetical protein
MTASARKSLRGWSNPFLTLPFFLLSSFVFAILGTSPSSTPPLQYSILLLFLLSSCFRGLLLGFLTQYSITPSLHSSFFLGVFVVSTLGTSPIFSAPACSQRRCQQNRMQKIFSIYANIFKELPSGHIRMSGGQEYDDLYGICRVARGSRSKSL